MPSSAPGDSAGATSLKERSEALVLDALQPHGFEHAQGFGNPGFDGLPLMAVAEMAGLSRPSVYNVQRRFGTLIDTPTRLDPTLGYAIGVDFGPRHARVAICRPARSALRGPEVRDRPPAPGASRALPLHWTARSIEDLLTAAEVTPDQVIGIGISQVAPINLRTGRPHPKGLTNKDWRDVVVGERLQQLPQWQGLPVFRGRTRTS